MSISSNFLPTSSYLHLSGSSYCQLMDMVVPNAINMTNVRVDSNKEEDYEHNFSVLQDTLEKNGITKVCTFS